MADKYGSRRYEKRKAFGKFKADQEQRLMQLIGSLPRGSLGGNDDDGGYSLSDNITRFQHENGLKADNREGLSMGQKKLLYDAGMADLNRVDQETFERETKADRRYHKGVDKTWAVYRTLYPEDHPDDVAAATAALRQQSGMSMSELAAIADDPTARRAAFERIHEAAIMSEIDRLDGGNHTLADDAYQPQPTAENRTAGFTGYSGGGYQPRERSHNREAPEGSLTDLIRQEQQRTGFKR